MYDEKKFIVKKFSLLKLPCAYSSSVYGYYYNFNYDTPTYIYCTNILGLMIIVNMSAFKSNRSKKSTMATVNKLIDSYLPSASTIQNCTDDNEEVYMKVIADDFSGPGASKLVKIKKQAKRIRKQKMLRQKMKTIKKKQKRAVIRKHLETRKEVELLGKLANGDKLTVDSIVNESISRLKSLKPSNQDEIAALEEDILDASRMRKDMRGANGKSRKQIQFDKKVSKGLVSVPGLTPGLAPVDSFDSFDDSPDESDGEAQLPKGFKDDYDDYH